MAEGGNRKRQADKQMRKEDNDDEDDVAWTNQIQVASAEELAKRKILKITKRAAGPVASNPSLFGRVSLMPSAGLPVAVPEGPPPTIVKHIDPGSDDAATRGLKRQADMQLTKENQHHEDLGDEITNEIQRASAAVLAQRRLLKVPVSSIPLPVVPAARPLPGMSPIASSSPASAGAGAAAATPAVPASPTKTTVTPMVTTSTSTTPLTAAKTPAAAAPAPTHAPTPAAAAPLHPPAAPVAAKIAPLAAPAPKIITLGNKPVAGISLNSKAAATASPTPATAKLAPTFPAGKTAATAVPAAPAADPVAPSPKPPIVVPPGTVSLSPSLRKRPPPDMVAAVVAHAQAKRDGAVSSPALPTVAVPPSSPATGARGVPAALVAAATKSPNAPAAAGAEESSKRFAFGKEPSKVDNYKPAEVPAGFSFGTGAKKAPAAAAAAPASTTAATGLQLGGAPLPVSPKKVEVAKAAPAAKPAAAAVEKPKESANFTFGAEAPKVDSYKPAAVPTGFSFGAKPAAATTAAVTTPAAKPAPAVAAKKAASPPPVKAESPKKAESKFAFGTEAPKVDNYKPATVPSGFSFGTGAKKAPAAAAATATPMEVTSTSTAPAAKKAASPAPAAKKAASPTLPVKAESPKKAESKFAFGTEAPKVDNYKPATVPSGFSFGTGAKKAPAAAEAPKKETAPAAKPSAAAAAAPAPAPAKAAPTPAAVAPDASKKYSFASGSEAPKVDSYKPAAVPSGFSFGTAKKAPAAAPASSPAKGTDASAAESSSSTTKKDEPAPASKPAAAAPTVTVPHPTPDTSPSTTPRSGTAPAPAAKTNSGFGLKTPTSTGSGKGPTGPGFSGVKFGVPTISAGSNMAAAFRPPEEEELPSMEPVSRGGSFKKKRGQDDDDEPVEKPKGGAAATTAPPAAASGVKSSFKETFKFSGETTAGATAKPAAAGLFAKFGDNKDKPAAASPTTPAAMPSTGPMKFQFVGKSALGAKPDTADKPAIKTAFAGFSSGVFGKDVAAPAAGGAGGETGDDNPEAFVPQFTVKQKIPEVKLSGAPVRTGEEDEEHVFKVRAKVFYMDNSDAANKRWRERGVGELHLNVEQATKKARLLLRTDGVKRLVLNAPLFAEMKVSLADERNVVINTFEQGKIVSILLRVSRKDEAAQLLEAINKHKATSPSIVGGGAAEGEAPAAETSTTAEST